MVIVVTCITSVHACDRPCGLVSVRRQPASQGETGFLFPLRQVSGPPRAGLVRRNRVSVSLELEVASGAVGTRYIESGPRETGITIGDDLPKDRGCHSGN